MTDKADMLLLLSKVPVKDGPFCFCDFLLTAEYEVSFERLLIVTFHSFTPDPRVL